MAPNTSSTNVPVPGVAVGGPVTITAASSVAGIASATTQITVVLGVTITTSMLPSGTVGRGYSAQVLASGGVAPLPFTATGLPAGLPISTAGLITGTPSGPAATSTAAITVTDSATPPHSTATANLPITIVTPLAITTTSLPAGVVGVAYTATTPLATGCTTPYHYPATGLPARLSIISA